ncbi:GGDEF domain-containing protein [Nitrincola sp. MINF-07-Sa-05]|uniref:GGDEF domain-containing protein n=1 Tax=Nitrincola salilacus TaxID=3400273 RepID=UPI003917C7CD
MALVTVTLSLRQELRFRDSLLYRQLFVLVVSLAIVYACYSVGLRGLIYTFPMASVFFFTFRLSHGVFTGVIFSVSCLLAALNVEEPLLVIRFSVGITICMVFASIFALIVGRQKADLERQAGIDELTGALNRRRLQETLDTALQLKHRHETPASLILVDLDHFKTIT